MVPASFSDRFENSTLYSGVLDQSSRPTNERNRRRQRCRKPHLSGGGKLIEA
jgi:hypothetical protein